MKKSMRIFAALFLLCWAGLAMLSVAAPSAWASPEPPEYEKAKVELARLRGDEKRAQYRHEWLKSADTFLSIYEKTPEWSSRPAALFRSAEALEEMARRSFVRKDAQDAASRFERLTNDHPSSVLADDALYRAAVIRQELLRDSKDARALLETIQRKYTRSDFAPKAVAYLAGLGGGNVASLAPTPSAKPAAATALVSQITPQLRQDTVRIVISLDRPSTWRVQHQMADEKAGRPARLIVDLNDASPDKSLKPGERYTKMGVFSRFAVDYTASKGQTRILLDFSKLERYTIRAEKSPFRIIVEATGSDKALAGGISVNPAAASRQAAAPARAVASANLAAQLGLTINTIVIDPGHGGKDPGTMHNSIVEREVSLDIAKRLGNVLRAAGYKVVFTRERDTWVSLTDRALFAEQSKGDLFISVHVNGSNKPEVTGFETYFLDLAGSKDSVRLASMENAGSGRGLGEMEKILTDVLLGARIQESRRLASAVQEKTMALLGKRGHATHNGGTKGAPFHVLIGSSMPGVLVEVGYCSNAVEAKLLGQSKYRDVLAEGIANGVHDYAQQLQTAAR